MSDVVLRQSCRKFQGHGDLGYLVAMAQQPEQLQLAR